MRVHIKVSAHMPLRERLIHRDKREQTVINIEISDARYDQFEIRYLSHDLILLSIYKIDSYRKRNVVCLNMSNNFKAFKR